MARRGIVTQLKWILVFVKEVGMEPSMTSPVIFGGASASESGDEVGVYERLPCESHAWAHCTLGGAMYPPIVM